MKHDITTHELLRSLLATAITLDEALIAVESRVGAQSVDCLGRLLSRTESVARRIRAIAATVAAADQATWAAVRRAMDGAGEYSPPAAGYVFTREELTEFAEFAVAQHCDRMRIDVEEEEAVPDARRVYSPDTIAATWLLQRRAA